MTSTRNDIHLKSKAVEDFQDSTVQTCTLLCLITHAASILRIAGTWVRKRKGCQFETILQVSKDISELEGSVEGHAYISGTPAAMFVRIGSWSAIRIVMLTCITTTTGKGIVTFNKYQKEFKVSHQHQYSTWYTQ